ncbi:S41 family peptidase [Emticicia agri]|uniref:Tail specific protease domain-containing protein n=1 Tax=Emticicia agri TaxID=2492393 RepID=A0A4Q5LWH4_9BACT|nr:S41 family peptidase [Emticicia agri]RYU93897.1 hypothetical protein EWM59_19855 [Emticicia agri]
MKQLLYVSGILLANTLYAQVDSCSCAANYNDLVSKTEENYIAYHQKVKGKPAEEKKYENFKQKLQKQSLITETTACIEVLENYVKYFKDGHLFVAEYPKYNEQQLKHFKSQLKEYPLTEPEALAYFKKNQPHLDPIEGVWYAENNAYQLAIIQNPDNARQFLAVVLNLTNTNWRPGYIKAVFTKNKEGYLTIYLSGNFSPARYVANIHKDAVMSIGSSIYWGKSYPSITKEQAYIHKNNASLPTLNRVDADNILLSIPSFLVEYKYLDSLIRANKTAITSTKNLIIDIRGNGGGNAIYFPLIMLYYTNPFQDSQGLALSSPNTIKYFEKLASYQKKVPGDTTLNLYARVVRDMKANRGKIVKGPLYPQNSSPAISEFPKQVCILIDRACASAAESFILHSKGFSNRVTTFGDNTFGMIDYTSTTAVSLLCKTQNYYLSYPTSTLHKDIPENGYNARGIAPDIKIPDTKKDKIQFVLNWLKKK